MKNKIILILFLLFSNVMFSQSISGLTEPCSNENVGYTYNHSCNGTCKDDEDNIYNSSISVLWSLNHSLSGEILNPNSLTTNIKWECPTDNDLKLSCQATCTSYVKVGTGCVASISVLPVVVKEINVKCPSQVSISGPSYIACCDPNTHTYNINNLGSQNSIEWEVSTTTGWEIINGQGTNSVGVKAGNSGSSQLVTVRTGYIGCNNEVKAISTFSVDRKPIIEFDFPWITEKCQNTTSVNFCIKPILLCSTQTVYSWQATPGNTKGGNIPSGSYFNINSNCNNTIDYSQSDQNENNGYIDLKVSATTPCGSKEKIHRIFIPGGVPTKPTWSWDGGMGDLCVGARNVIFQITNTEASGQYEWIFDNGTTSYTLYGEEVGTYFDEFGPTWAANPNSDVLLTIRAKNICGYALNTTFLISSARFKAINDQACDIYLQKKSKTIIANQNIVIYPNPITNMLTVLKPQNVKKGVLKVYNSLGKIIAYTEIENDININTETWSSGIYSVYLTDNIHTYTSKIEIKK